MFLGLEHTAIASPDPAGLAQWYVDYLGFRINYTYDVFYFVKAPNGTMLEIIPSEGDRAANAPKTPGIRHLAIAVENFDSAHQQLREQGVNFLGEPYKAGENRLVFFTDRDGNILHLIERGRPLP
jgi:glyoxylase I family protein